MLIAHYIESATCISVCYTVAMVTRTSLFAITLLAILAGCVSTQEAVDGPDSQAKALAFLEVKTAPDSFKGQSVVFGGVVLTARRLKGGTRIEVLQLPIDRSTRPGYDLTRSQGRFIAFQREFLDPATLPQGTRVTVTGDVTGSTTLPLDETEYTYPVIDIKRVQVWPRSEDLPPRMQSYYMGPGAYWGPYWGPFWRPWPYYW